MCHFLFEKHEVSNFPSEINATDMTIVIQVANLFGVSIDNQPIRGTFDFGATIVGGLFTQLHQLEYDLLAVLAKASSWNTIGKLGISQLLGHITSYSA